MPGADLVTIAAPVGKPEAAIEQARQLIGLSPRPTAIYAASDLYAKLIYQAAAERALRIPQDVSVVGFSDDDFAADMSPPLTTVRQSAYDIGATAGRVLLRLAEDGLPRTPLHEELPVLLCVRASTGAPRVEDHASTA